MNTVKNESPMEYNATIDCVWVCGEQGDEIIERAKQILEGRLVEGRLLDKPGVVRDFLIMSIEDPFAEHFRVVWVDASLRHLSRETLFKGTLTQSSVYPREVVRRALTVGAYGVFLCHNHPSGDVQPSEADVQLTKTLKKALALVDVRVLDHIIVGGGKSLSMAERGLI